MAEAATEALTEALTEAVDTAKGKLLKAKRLLDDAVCDLRGYGAFKIDPEDPYSIDIEDVRDFIFDALSEADYAVVALNKFNGGK
ncbi:MAG: hypothetical protein IKO72_07440 [Kiritimatiellae bacterium]|nr:hypothetical protein [Kiritimatiellia bacterium]